MSKAQYNKWYESYRSYTEVNFDGVDQWVEEDVEIAFTEGYWTGRIEACKWLIRYILPHICKEDPFIGDELLLKLRKSKALFENKLKRALSERGDFRVVGGADYDAYHDKKKSEGLVERVVKPNTMTKEVALAKFSVLKPKVKIDVMDRAMEYMEKNQGHNRDYAIACIIAEDRGMELR